MNISAALLVVWYCVSIIGFDVHTCMSSGKTFIATFAEGVACADIHPEHHCCCASCADLDHHDDHDAPGHESVDTSSCCSNEYQVIQLSGCRTQDDSDDKHFFDKISYSCIADVPVAYIAYARYYAEHVQFLEPDSGVLPPGDLCATFGVWRI